MGPIAHFHEPGAALQEHFDAAVVMTTILRPSLGAALRSVFRQTLPGRVQILIGIDYPRGGAAGDRRVLDAALAERPPHHTVTVLDLGYSLARRNGGLHNDPKGGALRTVLSYLANSRCVAYLDDDNWMGERHLLTLRAALSGQDWAWSLRWYAEEGTRRPIAIDRWESVGPGAGVYAGDFGGWVDPNCLMLDKIRCGDLLQHWTLPFIQPGRGPVPADRGMFDLLRRRRWASTGEATSFYTIQESDVNHAARLELIRRAQDAGDGAGGPPGIVA